MIASAKKHATRTSDTRLEIVMVIRSLEAAKAISAGNSSNLIASATMTVPLLVPYLPGAPWKNHTRHRLAEALRAADGTLLVQPAALASCSDVQVSSSRSRPCRTYR